ncbi:TonB-dependent receptor [Flavobacterium sp. HSC-61S13]|uniref:SusC/RagA family TonB-linked outer membrane protein n=1 Tax=Flavobacterium sp. HSC-61S13 TaxID=2910963 RepID=UPI00209CC820|nr:TonB-dependent receptor [Flavobacterium sp. HSC-61S13]MCP1997457.1 TonB-linked SusC/RagA family outer membrane protein [Flavobacterium sp. HSC-61S13]
MNKLYILLLLSVLFSNGLRAQELLVNGTVSDNQGPLPGVTVSVVGLPDTATMTDLDGHYQIRVDANGTLLFSYLGYETLKESVMNRSLINTVLKTSSEELGEVLITIPYGTAKKSTFTGSVGIVSGANIEKAQVSNVTKALQGTVAGLQSFSASGQPGSEATIRIRGIGSVNASSSPLYVVDGVPYDGTLSSIAASDIESITVLKDAASATLYGSRAANGVIMVTTKQGRKNSPTSLEITSKYGFSSLARRDYDQLNTNQYFELYWEALRNSRLDNQFTPAQAAQYATDNIVGRIGINPYGTNNPQPVGVDGKLTPGLQPLWNDDWRDALSQSAHYKEINLRVSGGGENSRYFISGGYLDDQGAVIESGFKRYNFRTNITSDVKDWLQVGLNVSGTHSIQNYPKQDDSAISNVIGFSRGVPSFYPIYERNLENGTYLIDPNTGQRIFDYGNYRGTSYAKHNLVGSMPHDKNEIKTDAASVRTFAEVKILDNLKFKTSLNVDYNSRFTHNYINPSYGADALNGGSVSKSNVRTVGMTFNNVLNYNLDINDRNSISALAGQEFYSYNTSKFGGTREKLITDGFYEPDAASVLSAFQGNSDEYKLLSFFGNVEYALDKKYFLSGSVRSDGSSRFHPDNRWGTFWSVGASWRVIEEDFIQNLRDKGLSNLSLKMSYGAQGNDNIGYYAYQALYAIQNNLGESGLIASRLATPNLSWETNLNLNIGLDYGLFNNRLTGTVEYFERKSKDLLFNKSLVPSTGFSSTSQNIGAIKNYGFEFTIEGTPIATPDWNWRLSLNATTYKNKIVSLPSAEMWSGAKKWVEGGSLYDFYLVEWAGVNPQNGNAQWYRYEADGTKVITEDYASTKETDKVKSGNSLPDVSGGFQSDLSYKGFELSALFTYSIGGKIYNGDKQSLQHLGAEGATWSTDMLNRWTPENTITDVPRLTTDPKSSWLSQSDRFLVDRSFLKLKTVTLSYNLPQNWLQKVKLERVSVYLQAENLLTFTKEQGLDPEQNLDGTTYYRYPSMKTISFGVNVKL